MIRFACRLALPTFAFDVAFEAQGGVTALFGPSGAGKSTAIRLMAGLERPDSGRIVVDDVALVDTERRVFLAPHRRRIGLVFQDALLMPHLSVRANLTYGRFFTAPADRRLRFDPVVEVLGIGHLLERRPGTLSGGERQRVAIGRALLASPRLLLMDEPLASLDGARKLEILPFIERLRDEFAIPIVYVSHAVEEVARLASHVVTLDEGKVVAAGAPAEVLGLGSLRQSADRFDAMSILTARIVRYMPEYGVTLLHHLAGDIVVAGRLDPAGAAARIAIRATNVTLAVGPPGAVSVRTVLSGRLVKLETDAGPFALATIALPGGDVIRAYATRLATDALALSVGDPVQALVKSVAIDERGVPGLAVGARP